MSLVLKLEYSGDIRRTKIATGLTLRELVDLASSSWLVPSPSFSYTDSDGDSINIVTDADWRSAIEYGTHSGLLRVKVSRTGRPAEIGESQAAPVSSSSAAAQEPADAVSRAVALFNQDDGAGALSEITQAREADPNNVVLLLLQRTVHRAFPTTVSGVHPKDPTTELVNLAKAAGADAIAGAENYLRHKQLCSSDSIWQLLLGHLFDLVQGNSDAAIPFFRAASQGSGRAAAAGASALGVCYEKASENAQALRYFRLAAEAGDPAGMCNYARLLPNGDATRLDWLQRAAATKIPAALYNLSLESDDEQSFALLEEAANLGLAVAQWQIGMKLYDGTSHQGKSEIQALSWFVTAAEQDLPEARYMLGTIYLNGVADLLDKDEEQAVRYLTQAAEANIAEAQYTLGTIYDEGNSVITADATQAFQWYLRAAVNNLKSAQLEVGSMYAEGRGVEASEDEAQKWFLIATGETANNTADLVASLRGSALAAPEPPRDAGLDTFQPQSAPIVRQSQEELVAFLADNDFVGPYYAWTSPDADSWDPTVRVVLGADGSVTIGDERADGRFSRNDFDVDGSAVSQVTFVWGEPSHPGLHGELTFVSGASVDDPVWGEDLSKDCKLFSGWIERYGEPRVAIRGFRTDTSSIEFRSFVPDCLEQSVSGNSSLTTAQLQQLKESLIAFERFIIRVALSWNDVANERQQWARNVRAAEFGSDIAQCLKQLMANIKAEYVSRDLNFAALSQHEITVPAVAEALLDLEISLPWSAVVPLFRTYRSAWRDALSRIVSEPVAEIQQFLHTSTLGPARQRSSAAVVVSTNHSPLYRFASGLAANDSVRIRAQLQSSSTENLSFNINFNGTTPDFPEFQVSFKRPSGDAGIITFNYGYGSNSDLVSAEGHPFPLVAEDFYLVVTVNGDQSISVSLEGLAINFTSPPLPFIVLADIDRVHFEAPHGRVLLRSVEHSFTRTTALQPGE